MRYKITHNTTYAYSDMVAVCQNLAHLQPRTRPGQTCRYHRLVIKPTPAANSRRLDYFGNPVNYFSLHEGHKKLTVTSISKVEVRPKSPPSSLDATPWESVAERVRADLNLAGLDAYQFTFDSPRVTRSPQLAEYARLSFTPGRPTIEALSDLTARIHREFTYDTSATHTHTQLEEIVTHQRGVCQDFAHVQIACLRSLGLPARYVSGYLRTHPPPGQAPLVGRDASHAWISLFDGREWIDADPTNNVLPSTEHITVAWGRDYSDVAPITGIYVGGGQQTITVSVNVAPLDEDRRSA